MNGTKRKFEELLPHEILAMTNGASIVFLPIGSMEWHGPHMSMGMDTAHAYAVALGLAEAMDGTALPPLYIGTEQPRTPEMLKKVGFSGSESVVGMDFPANAVKSMYWPEELFSAIIRQQALFLVELGFRTVVLVNGHGADNQIACLERIADSLTAETGANVINQLILSDDCGVGVGHAGLLETAVMLALVPQGVDCEKLPKKPTKLKNTEFAIVDSETFISGGNENFTVRYDPRDATAGMGRSIIAFEIERCRNEILKRLARE